MAFDKNKDKDTEWYKQVANMIIERAKELTPIDTGRLINSFRIEYNGSDIRIVNYCKYAPYVHEMEVHHVIGQNKFLEQASFEIGCLFNVKTQVCIYVDKIVCYLDCENKHNSKNDNSNNNNTMIQEETIRKDKDSVHNLRDTESRRKVHNNMDWNIDSSGVGNNWDADIKDWQYLETLGGYNE